MWLYVSLVEDEDERKLCFIEDPECVIVSNEKRQRGKENKAARIGDKVTTYEQA